MIARRGPFHATFKFTGHRHVPLATQRRIYVGGFAQLKLQVSITFHVNKLR
jgi:hypothetical protein